MYLEVKQPADALSKMLDTARLKIGNALIPSRMKKISTDGTQFTIMRPGVLRTGIFNTSSKQEQLKAFRSIVFAMVHVRATEVANAGKAGKFKAVIERDQDKTEMLPMDHPLVRLLRSPNPVMTRWGLWYVTVCFLDLIGNSYWWLSRDRLRVPRSVWPLPAQRVSIIKGDPQKGEEIIKQYKIDWGSGNETILEADDIVHLKYPNPSDLYYYGESLVMRAAAEIDIDWFMTMHQHEFGANDAMPSAIVTFPDVLTPDARAAFEEEWIDKFQRKPGRVGYLEGGATFSPITTQKELEYIESTGVNRKRLQAIFGVPDSKLMLEEGISARATLETLDYNFLKEKIDPLCTMIDEQLTLDLAKNVFDPKLAVVHDSVVPKDDERQATLDKIQLDSGVTHINEIREREGLDPYPYPAADEPLVAFGLVPISEVGSVSQPTTGQETPPPPPPEDQVQQDGFKNMAESDVVMLWKSHDDFLKRWEKHFAQVMRHYFLDIRKEVLGNIAKPQKALSTTLSASEIMFDIEAWTRKLRRVVTSETLAIIKNAFVNFVSHNSLGNVIFNASDPGVQEGIARITVKTRTVPQTFYDDLFKVVKTAIDQGKSTPELAADVSKFFQNQVDFRSFRIARTNANYAINKGNETAAIKSQVFENKVWITQRDNFVRDLHKPMDGIAVDLKGKFKLYNGDVLDTPGDPNATHGESVINCRCSLFYQKKES